MYNLISLNSRRLNSWRLFIFLAVFALINLRATGAYAHQSPNTLVFADVNPKTVRLELQMPLTELELAFGNNISQDPENLIKNFGPQLEEYLKAHIHAYVTRTNPWSIAVESLRMEKGSYAENNIAYWELVAFVTIVRQPGESTRKFTLDYDVIIHQVMNHAALVSIRRDWEAGKIDPNVTSEAIVISRNTRDNVIYPLQVNLEDGSWFKGFKTMVNLGISHIAEGTDHLLFLLTLLLPAALIAAEGRWTKAGSIRYSLTRILKIVTAFTIGHSITLLIGALNLFHFPSQPIEVLIAVSILVSAIHAIKPIFPGKEIFIAAGFGLIHGMAFAQTLSNLQLDFGHMALSILGFNIGIESMQLFVIVLTMPWLIILSRSGHYAYVRIIGAVLAGIAAISWIIERVGQNPNLVSNFITQGQEDAKWVILFLAMLSIISHFSDRGNRYFLKR
jgi:hypothetical protein